MQDSEAHQETERDEWSRPKPETLAAPTYWPAALAFGVTLLAWGLVTSWIILTIGASVFVVSLAGWIRDIRHEQEEINYGSEHNDNES